LYAKLNGTEIFFDSEGSTLRRVRGDYYEVPTIITLPGIVGLDHRYLRDGLGPLSEFAQVVYVDLRGQGKSAHAPVETITHEQMADDIAALVEELGIRKPYLFAHSLGGLVATQVVLRHPGLARGVILAAPTAVHTHVVITSMATSHVSRASPLAVEVAEQIRDGGVSTASIAKYLGELGPLLAAPMNASLAARLTRGSAPNIELMRHLLTVVPPDFVVNPPLEQMSVPILLLAGAHDWLSPPRQSLAMATRIPRSRFVEFENSGHLLFSEEPASFRAAIEDFLASDATPGWY
jgi:proline iminopeptidase